MNFVFVLNVCNLTIFWFKW